ncbi:MAG: HlyD family type I secretion periplasmic adaptor subunit [Alteromonadaceae bacterium]|nr:HlyD family type I secretion periplasmic adaptor subunit [Alteromonadaceae bacterium]
MENRENRDNPESRDNQEPQDNQSAEWEEVDESTDLTAEYTRKTDDDIDKDAQAAIPTGWSARVKVGIIVLLVTFVGFGGWAFLAPLDGAAIADGKVVVESQNRVVQHLEGGIVDEIYVDDGDTVKAGEPLLELSATRPRADLEIVESELTEVLGREARLLAERMRSDEIAFPPELLENRESSEKARNVIAGQKELFQARKEALEGRLTIFEQRIDSLNAQMRGLRSQNQNLQNRIQSYEEELENWQALYEQELADRTRINEMQRELYRLQGEKDSNEAQIAQLNVKVGETRSEMLVTRQEFVEQVATKLRETQQTKSDLVARQVALKDTLQRTTLYAPDTGTVVGKTVHTVGGVISAGDVVMEIVPKDQEYIVTARVKPQDIDRIAIGQLADLQFSAFNLQMSHVIEGEVVGISADAFEDEQSGDRYYEARVKLTEAGMQRMDEQGMFLVSGMPATVLIKTGERTLFQYLVEPITRMFSRSFREA